MERMQYEIPTLVQVEVKQKSVVCASQIGSGAKMNVTYEEETW